MYAVRWLLDSGEEDSTSECRKWAFSGSETGWESTTMAASSRPQRKDRCDYVLYTSLFEIFLSVWCLMLWSRMRIGPESNWVNKFCRYLESQHGSGKEKEKEINVLRGKPLETLNGGLKRNTCKFASQTFFFYGSSTVFRSQKCASEYGSGFLRDSFNESGYNNFLIAGNLVPVVPVRYEYMKPWYR